MNGQRSAQRPAEAARRVRFGVLGPFEASLDGSQAALGSPKQRALLAALLLRPGEAMSVEELVDELWPEHPPETARHAVRVYVSRLRAAFGDAIRIEARSGAYVLHDGGAYVDVRHFRALVDEARAALAREPAAAAGRLREALALWRGRALADLDDEPGVRDLVLELDEERVDALELRLEAELAAGAGGELVPELERLVAHYPARETFGAQLMLALYRAGRQAEALEVYRRARRSLREELGLEPGRRLRELQAAILRQEPGLFVDPPELRARRHLPAQPNAFVGRGGELEELVRLVGSDPARLVTLTGPGGVGKTRLALAVAERLATQFTDGVWFVGLESVDEPDLVPTAIARALGVDERRGEPLTATLAAFLRERELLLVVDNVEHVLAGATALSELLREAPRLKVVATSRVLLDLYGEHAYEVEPLGVPAHADVDIDELRRHDSVILFADRARAARRDFSLTTGNVPAVVAVCAALDGLPLALELGAARLRTTTLDALARDLTERLSVLGGGPRDVPDRQRTLAAAIDWSYELLSPNEKRLLRYLSVFAGGFTAGTVEDLTGMPDSSCLLEALVTKSLVRREGDRYSMLQTIAAYAAERLEREGEREELHARHAEVFARLAEVAGPLLTRDAALDWTRRLDAEHDNLRAALARALDRSDATTAARIAAAVWRFWYHGSFHREARTWIDAILRSGETVPSALRSQLLNAAGVIAADQGDLAAARRYQDESLALCRAEGDRRGIAFALGDLSTIAFLARDFERALTLLAEATALFQELGDRWALAVTALNAATWRLYARDDAGAKHALEEALPLAREIGDQDMVGKLLHGLGVARLRLGDAAGSAAAFGEAARTVDAVGDRVTLACCFEGLAAVAAIAADREAAVQLLRAAQVLHEQTGVPPLEDDRALLEPYLSDLEPDQHVQGRAERDSLLAYARAYADSLDRVASTESAA